jgi:hypothetical protein
MATSDIQALLESRLRMLVPTESLEPGSRAQVDFIQPVLEKLGTDPLETDIETFIDDRFAQEYPEIFAGNPSLVRDIFSKPLRTLLEPFKREINILKINQSLKDPSLLSDDDADALAANVFATRPAGNVASGVARVYYANPNNVQVELTHRFFTSDGLNFFPNSPSSVTAEQMVFNREGPLFYFDVSVQAENVGSEYNIGPNMLSGVDGLYGVVKVSNPAKFDYGASTVDTPTFVQQAGQSLTELSLVTRRGATARINKEFSGQVRAVQVIGAKDAEMERDLLVATAPGHSWLTGDVTIYQHLAYVQINMVDGDPYADAVKEGDVLFVYFAPNVGLTRPDSFVELTVEKVISGPLADTTGNYDVDYLVEWSGDFPLSLNNNFSPVRGGFRRTPTVTVSSLPTIGAVSASAASGSVHTYGHTDIYVRPSLQPESKTILSGLYDYKSFIEGTQLTTQYNGVTNRVLCVDVVSAEAAGVSAGDVLVIEQGADAGTYIIGKVVASMLYLTTTLSTPATLLRYRILKKIRIDPFTPSIPRYPFAGGQHNDLSTTIGLNVFTLSTVDLTSYGARVGDVFRITSGLDQGDFTITNISGYVITVDRAASSTATGITYEVFTALDAISKPLVRIKSVELLDSAQQTTGITVPPAEPVAVVPTSDFTSARVRGGSQGSTGYVLPDLSKVTSICPQLTWSSFSGVYSQGFLDPAGNYRSVVFSDNSKDQLALRNDAYGACNYFISTVDSGVTPPIDPNPGECLTIKTGPNKGSYLIKAVYKFKYRVGAPGFGSDRWVYFIQIYGTFPVDVFAEIVNFLNLSTDNNAHVSSVGNTGDISFPGFFNDPNTGLLSTLGAKMRLALIAKGTTAPAASVLQAQILEQVAVSYEWGDPARGVLRTYMQEPTLVEQQTGTSATTFSYKTPSGDYVKFRPDPGFYTKQQLFPVSLDGNEDPKNFPRDLDASVAQQVTLTDVSKPSPFAMGIQAGDMLSVHLETFTTKSRAYGVSSVAGSSTVTDPTGLGQFTSSLVGDYLSIDEGTDSGLYKILSVSTDGNSLTLDTSMTETTPTILAWGHTTNNGLGGGNSHVGAYYDTANDIVVVNPATITGGWVGKYVTIYNVDYTYQGSFLITNTTDSPGTSPPGTDRTLLTVDRGSAGHFPLIGAGNHLTDVMYVVTAAPVTVPLALNSNGTGTVLYGVKSMRIYSAVPTDYWITGVSYTNPASHVLTFSNSVLDSTAQPYRIYRNGIRRVTPTAMASQQDGAYVYFDTEVVSMAPQSAANIAKGSYLTTDEGSYTSVGYRHTVTDRTLTYSTQESGWVDFPLFVLPVGNIDRSDNYIYLFGSPLLITYEAAPLIQSIQNFVDSPLDRVTVANILVRHFLPQYVSYDALYYGGGLASVIAQTIIDNINNTPIETPLDVSEQFEKAITNTNGNPETPTKVMVLLHDWQRRRWLEMSENKIGGVAASIPYDGSSRVAYYVPGPDKSGQTSVPYGERILLTRG